MMLVYLVFVPIVFGILCMTVLSRIRILAEITGIFISAVAVIIGFWLFLQSNLAWQINHITWLYLDGLSRFVLLFSQLFGFLILLYSLRYFQSRHPLYDGVILVSLGAANGVILASHLLVLLVFWGVLGITLYLLVMTGESDASWAAKKSLIMVGGSDALLLLGCVLIYKLTAGFDMQTLKISIQSGTSSLVFLCFALSAFAKAGAMPLHTWIPDVADKAPLTVTAFLPAALDKLLGIYLLARMSLDWFVLSKWTGYFLLIVGSVTILAAVMMALIQHDMKRLLAYHAVSQVGYMVLGIGTGNPLGIAGGLFHMVNHSLYKSCLFLTAGAVKHRTGTTHLDQLGGLGREMPVTFVCFLIAAFAISGIPPFNGFASKWMIYQGVIQMGQSSHPLWIVWLIAALFGSGLTLASFMKLTHSVFLGIPNAEMKNNKIKDVPIEIKIPMVILASICFIFGAFAFQLPIRLFLSPILPDLKVTGLWSPDLATFMILLGIVLGLIIYMASPIHRFRQVRPFIGGESLPNDTRITGVGFYDTIRSMKGINKLYQWAEQHRFDCYEQGMSAANYFSNILRKCHAGYLNGYLLWVMMGIIVLMFVFSLN